MKRNWYCSSAHDSSRSLHIVRIVVALILLTHPIHALMHPGDIRGFGHFLASHGLPWSAGLAWAAILLQAGCSLALLAGRFVAPACAGHIFVLGMGIWLVHAPRWRTVGLPDGDHQPGSEFSVLMIACLLGVLWANRCGPAKGAPEQEERSARQGLTVVRIAAALILMIHPIGGLRDPAGLNDLGL